MTIEISAVVIKVNMKIESKNPKTAYVWWRRIEDITKYNSKNMVPKGTQPPTIPVTTGCKNQGCLGISRSIWFVRTGIWYLGSL